jgi:hypothetical protein
MRSVHVASMCLLVHANRCEIPERVSERLRVRVDVVCINMSFTPSGPKEDTDQCSYPDSRSGCTLFLPTGHLRARLRRDAARKNI